MTSTSTSAEREGLSIERLKRGRAIRRVLLAALFIFLLLGLTNRLGVTPRTVSSQGNGYRLSVTYTHVGRLGLAAPWTVRVTRTGGFDGPVTLATTASYFEIFDENGLDPDPASATMDGDTLIWEFDPPPGDTLTVSFDARIEPTYHGGRTATTAVRVDGRDVVSVTFRTRVMP